MIVIDRKAGLGDKLREYKIYIDGQIVDSIAEDETKTLNLEKGKHELLLKIDWARSNMVCFELEDDEILHFTCRSAATPVRLVFSLFAIIFLWKNWITLEYEP